MKKKSMDAMFSQEEAEQNDQKQLTKTEKAVDELDELKRHYQVHVDEEDDFAGY